MATIGDSHVSAIKKNMREMRAFFKLAEDNYKSREQTEYMFGVKKLEDAIHHGEQAVAHMKELLRLCA